MIIPKNTEQLRERIAKRIDDSEDQFKDRISTAIRDIEDANKSGIFNNFIVNDELEQAKSQFATLIDALYFQEIEEIIQGTVSKDTGISALKGVKIGSNVKINAPPEETKTKGVSFP